MTAEILLAFLILFVVGGIIGWHIGSTAKENDLLWHEYHAMANLIDGMETQEISYEESPRGDAARHMIGIVIERLEGLRTQIDNMEDKGL